MANWYDGRKPHPTTAAERNAQTNREQAAAYTAQLAKVRASTAAWLARAMVHLAQPTQNGARHDGLV